GLRRAVLAAVLGEELVDPVLGVVAEEPVLVDVVEVFAQGERSGVGQVDLLTVTDHGVAGLDVRVAEVDAVLVAVLLQEGLVAGADLVAEEDLALEVAGDLPGLRIARRDERRVVLSDRGHLDRGPARLLAEGLEMVGPGAVRVLDVRRLRASHHVDLRFELDRDVALATIEGAELAGVAGLAGVGLALDLTCHGVPPGRWCSPWEVGGERSE